MIQNDRLSVSELKVFYLKDQGIHQVIFSFRKWELA